ncbi:MAG: alkaline phosphatase family protein [Pseudomonadota bacterium]
MPAKILVLGLDAAEATLIERWAAEGTLTTFAALAKRAAVFRLDTPLETLPEGIWHELHTGLSAGKIGRYYVTNQIHNGEAKPRPVTAAEIDPEEFFWTQAGRAGHRIAALDMVHTVPAENLNGLQLFEWGLHDRHFSTMSEPPELLAEITQRHGAHPIGSCDDHGATPEGYQSLLDGLTRSVEAKRDIYCDLLGRESWDLFAATFAESHCVGHQFWHFLDPGHPRHDPAAPAEFADAVKQIYARLDQALGAVIEAAGEETVVLVVASHGMGLYVGGYQLLPEVLLRLGLGPAGAQAERGHKTKARALYHALRGRYGFITGGKRPFSKSSLGRRVRAYFGTPISALDSPDTKATAALNNRVGAIRLNLKGREPNGQVAPGNEAGDLIGELRQELMSLEHPELGEPIVDRVLTAQEAFGADRHPDVPDLMVVFRTDLGQLEACRSDRVGLIRRPLFSPHKPRTGDHTTESRLWIAGPGVPAQSGRARAVDLSPTVLRLLGVTPPEGIDGRAIDCLHALYADNR